MSLPDFSNPSNRLSVVAGARVGVTSAPDRQSLAEGVILNSATRNSDIAADGSEELLPIHPLRYIRFANTT